MAQRLVINFWEYDEDNGEMKLNSEADFASKKHLLLAWLLGHIHNAADGIWLLLNFNINIT